jgi:toxin HigB-1
MRLVAASWALSLSLLFLPAAGQAGQRFVAKRQVAGKQPSSQLGQHPGIGPGHGLVAWNPGKQASTPAIVSFGDKATEDFFHNVSSKDSRRIPANLAKVARRKLDMVNAAKDLNDLRNPPANHLEALNGPLKGYHSIRVNDQYRIMFRWTQGGPAEVRFIDYH